MTRKITRKKHIRKLLKASLWTLLAMLLPSVIIVGAFRFIDPSTSAVILAWERDTGKQARHQWQDLEFISPQLQLAVITAEDQKFPHHFGFDFSSISKAVSEGKRRPRGASTISQQVAKNLFLWNGRSYIRKGLEAWLTLMIESLWPKERILEVYLNIAEFGPGIYGAEAAADRFFSRSAYTLTQWQSGLMAAVLPNPRKMSAARPSDYVANRAQTIMAMGEQLGGIRYLQQLAH